MRFFAKFFLLIVLIFYVIVIGIQLVPRDGTGGTLEVILEKGDEVVSSIKIYFFGDEELVTLDAPGNIVVPLPITRESIPEKNLADNKPKVLTPKPKTTITNNTKTVSVTDPLNLICSSAVYGADIVWSASASGGTGGYLYSIENSSYINSSIYRVTYTSSGTKKLLISVKDSAGVSTSISCTREITIPDVQKPTIVKTQALSSTCLSTSNGSQITWQANPSGGVSPYRFTWSGDVNGTNQEVINNYGTSGTKNAVVAVTDSAGSNISASCSGTVTVPDVVHPTLTISPGSIIHKPLRATPISITPEPPRYDTISDWAKCYPPGGDTGYYIFNPQPNCPNKNGWLPQDVINIMKAYPNYYFDLGQFAGRAPGYTNLVYLGKNVNEVQRLAKEQGVDVSKILIHFRADVESKAIDSSLCFNSNCSLAGKMNGSKGDLPFNTDWITRVPTSLHQKVIDTFWAGRDPFDHPEDWAGYTDRAWITALNTPDQKVALYGPINTSLSAITPTSFNMDLGIPAYRTWSIKKLLYTLEDYGLDPNESFTIELNFKPGWYPYYTGTPNTTDPCFVEKLSDGTPIHLFTGPAHVCGGNPGGPLEPLLYDQGEYETIVNSYIKEVTLELENAGYNNFTLSFVDRPMYKYLWSMYTDETLRNPYLLGEPRNAILPDANNLPQVASVSAVNGSSFIKTYAALLIQIGLLILALVIYLVSISHFRSREK